MLWLSTEFSRMTVLEKCTVRGEYVEVVCIPSSVKHDQLEPTVCRIQHQIVVKFLWTK